MTVHIKTLVFMLLASAPAIASEYTLETSVITDWETISYYGSQEEAQKAIDSAMDYATIIFRQQLSVNIEVIYTDIPLTADDDTIANHNHPEFLIESIHDYRIDNQNHMQADVTVFLTTRELSSGSIEYAGYTNLTSVCESGAIAIVRLDNYGLDGQTLSHELAHILGAVHDGDEPCENVSSRGYLMSSDIYTGNDNLSQCSINTIESTIDAIGSCLTEDANTPAIIDTTPPRTSIGGHGSTGIFLLLILFIMVVISTLSTRADLNAGRAQRRNNVFCKPKMSTGNSRR